MDTLRLGSFGLSPLEAGIISGLLELNAGQADWAAWEYVSEPAFDLLFVDQTVTKKMMADEGVTATFIVRVADTQPTYPANALLRPILSNQLLECLVLAKIALPQQHSDCDDRLLSPVTLFLADSTDNQTAYRVNQWPPAAVLRNDPARILMAKLLSEQAIALEQLAQAAQQPIEKVRQFIHVLRSTGLLLVQTAA